MANARDKFSAIAAYLEREHDTKTITQYGKPTVVYGGDAILAYAYDSLGVKLHGRAMDHLLKLPETRGWNPVQTMSDAAPGWVLVPVRHFYRWDKIAMDAVHCIKHAQAGSVVRYKTISTQNESQTSPLPDLESAFANAMTIATQSESNAIAPAELPQTIQSFNARDFERSATPTSKGLSWSDRLKNAMSRIGEWKIG